MTRSASGGRRTADGTAAAPPPIRLTGTLRLLLIVLALAAAAAGIDAATRSPLPHGGLSTGLAVLVGAVFVIAVLRAATGYRAHMRRTFPDSVAVDRLRAATFAVLLAAAVLVPAIAIALHYRAPGGGEGNPYPTGTASNVLKSHPIQAAGPPQGNGKGSSLHIPFGTILLVLSLVALAALLIAAALLAARLLRGLPEAGPVAAPGGPTESGGQLAEALDAGRSALAGDDARAAIIACYAAMEKSLAAAGEARRRSDSPSDLLQRATARQLVAAAPARELTELFREARYSTHPMGPDSLLAARRALDTVADELAASLAAAAAAEAQAALEAADAAARAAADQAARMAAASGTAAAPGTAR